MKPSTELFDLISTLTKSEKRFFKLQSSLQSGDKNYVRLFDLIEKMEVYDEEAVKSTFKGEKFINHLPSEKNHLYKLILKSLRSYYSETSVSSMLKQEIKNVEILYNKGLFEECTKFLERAKKQAIKYEKFYYLFELISWEKTLLEEAFENGHFVDLDKLIAEEQEVLDKLRNLTAYHVLYSKINYVFRSGGYSRTEENTRIIDEIVDHPLIKGKNTALSMRAATICYYTQGFCNIANGNTAVALEKYLRVKQILDEHPELRSDLAKRYVRTLSQIIQCQLELKQFDEAQSNIALMEGLGETEGFDTPDTSSRIFSEITLSKIKSYLLSARFSEGVNALGAVAEQLKGNEGKLHKEVELRLYYYLAYLYFGAGQFNKALHWLNKVNNDNENDLRQDLYGYARLFNIVIHYELGNSDLLEYTIKSTARYLQKRNRDFEFEKQVLDQFKKLIRTNGANAKREILQEFKDNVQTILQQETSSAASPELSRSLLKYFDFTAWIDAKLDGQSFEEHVRQKTSAIQKSLA
jgi:tetratricopeptide (TPR) repeat protein